VLTRLHDSFPLLSQKGQGTQSRLDINLMELVLPSHLGISRKDRDRQNRQGTILKGQGIKSHLGTDLRALGTQSHQGIAKPINS
jgi:hypothetical protein